MGFIEVSRFSLTSCRLTSEWVVFCDTQGGGAELSGHVDAGVERFYSGAGPGAGWIT